MDNARTLTTDELLNLFDDIEPVEHDETPENTGVPTLAPVPAGKYGIQLVAIDVDRDQQGAVRNKQQFVVDMKVTVPPPSASWAEGRTVRFIRVSGKTSKRKGKDGIERPFVELFDLVHAFDPTFNCANSLERAALFLLERVADGATAYVQLDWKAFDTKHFNASNGDTLQDGSDEKKALFKACAIRGQKHFQPDGTLINPASGNLLKANVYMKWAYVPAVTAA